MYNVPVAAGRININSAPLPVLMSAPGMTLDVAQAIIEHRKVKPFQNTCEISKELGIPAGTPALSLLSTEQTGVYTLTASGHREGSKVRRTIRAVVILDPGQFTRYRIVYWNENVPNL